MTSNRIITLMNRSPFVPLKFHLTDGATILVENPYDLAVRPNSPDIVIFEEGRIRFVACRNIAEIVTDPINGSIDEVYK